MEPTLAAWLTNFLGNGAQVYFAHIPMWAHLLIIFVTSGILGLLNRQNVTPVIKTQPTVALSSAEKINPEP